MIHWYVTAFKRYRDFSHRASRAEYWSFMIGHVPVYMMFVAIQVLVTGAVSSQELLVADLYAIAVVLPSIAVSVRRLHDVGRSGWWLILVPVALWLAFCEGTPRHKENIYGRASLPQA